MNGTDHYVHGCAHPGRGLISPLCTSTMGAGGTLLHIPFLTMGSRGNTVAQTTPHPWEQEGHCCTYPTSHPWEQGETVAHTLSLTHGSREETVVHPFSPMGAGDRLLYTPSHPWEPERLLYTLLSPMGGYPPVVHTLLTHGRLPACYTPVHTPMGRLPACYTPLTHHGKLPAC